MFSDKSEESLRNWLSIKEVADELGVNRSSVQGWMDDGLIPYLKIKRTIRIPKEGLREALSRQMVNAELFDIGDK